MVCLFDTSALNQLHNDPDREPLIAGIISGVTVRVSAVNVVEIAMTTNSVRMHSLMQLADRLSCGFRPLDTPEAVLGQVAKMYASGEQKAEVGVSEEREGLCELMNHPDTLDHAGRERLRDWVAHMNSGFRDMHQQTRNRVDEQLRRDLRTASVTIRHHSSREAETFILSIVSPMYNYLTNQPLDSFDRVRQFFEHCPHWAAWWGALMYAAWGRAIRTENFGDRYNAGGVDTWSAVYLPLCDVFVTADSAQHRTLRMASAFAGRRTRVISYTAFRRHFLIDSP